MHSNNIGQISYLQSEKHNLQRIYFGGSFIRGHQQTIHTLAYAIRFWSKSTKQAYFLRHEGYLGAVRKSPSSLRNFRDMLTDESNELGRRVPQTKARELGQTSGPGARTDVKNRYSAMMS